MISNFQKMKYYLCLIITLLLLFLAPAAVYTQAYPEIESLQLNDPLFKQLTEDIARYYRASASSRQIPDLALYQYTTNKNDTIIAIAARFNLPYETIAILNGINRYDELTERTTLLIPNIPGVFVPKNPHTDIERLIYSWRLQRLEENQTENHMLITIRTPQPKKYYFFPGERFNDIERAYFFGILFRFPLPDGILSSPFGVRLHPFTGKETFHRGIDIAAPENTEVYAARNGTVIAADHDLLLGNYIILSHSGGYETVYAHLKKIFVELHQEVRSGMIIGTVGSTGLSTGPHLHFEVRREGRVKDPLPLIPIQQ